MRALRQHCAGLWLSCADGHTLLRVPKDAAGLRLTACSDGALFRSCLSHSQKYLISLPHRISIQVAS
jgi:hypothetical protein